MSILVNVRPYHATRAHRSQYGRKERIIPLAMAERLDKAILAWIRSWGKAAGRPLPGFMTPARLDGFSNISHISYLPGRTPLAPETRGLQRIRVSQERDFLKRKQWLPRKLKYILKQAQNAILHESARVPELPFLTVESGLQEVLRAAFADPLFDMYASQKSVLTHHLLERLDDIREIIIAADDRLAASLDLSVRANYFGRPQTNELAHRLTAGSFDAVTLLEEPLSYYVNDTAKVLGRLKGAPLNIVYILDNAGEACLDLLFTERLLTLGHKVTVVAKSRPCFNDETYDSLCQIITPQRFRLARYRFNSQFSILPGWDIPGIDLLSTPRDVEAALNSANLAIVKGEGNFEGMPPDHAYSFDTVYLFQSKTAGLDQQLPGMAHPPNKGEGIVYLKAAGK
ncbi:MAG: DUF89 family protein [Candidatus Saganbacteria bacterium]|nr:DUF89 family protein [Candidatus Saganbacteria bacterium]